MICQNCGTENSDCKAVCVFCGEKLSSASASSASPTLVKFIPEITLPRTICQSCGEENDVSVKICVICGADLASRPMPIPQKVVAQSIPSINGSNGSRVAQVTVNGIICPTCNKTNPTNAVFCDTCGEGLAKNAPILQTSPSYSATPSKPIYRPKRPNAPYPYFSRSPRIIPDYELTDVEILAPPNAGAKPVVSWLSLLLSPALMIIVMGVITYVTKNISMMLFSIPMSLIGVIVAIVNNKIQVSRWQKNQVVAKQKYDAHLQDCGRKIVESEAKYRTYLESINPNLAQCVNFAVTRGVRLWERSIYDKDFMTVRLGTSDIPSNVTVKAPSAQLTLEENPFLTAAHSLRDAHTTLAGVPFSAALGNSAIVGLVGNRKLVIDATRTMLINVTAQHSYEDVKVVCMFPKSEQAQWDWAKWLPHIWNKKQRRMAASTASEAKEITDELMELIKARNSMSGNSQGAVVGMPYYFVVVADATYGFSLNSGASSGVTAMPSLGMTIVYAYGEHRLLPSECQTIIEYNGNVGKMSGKAFTIESTTVEQADQFARALAPVRFKTAAGTADMPTFVTFLQGYGAKTIEELNIQDRWRKSVPFMSLAAPLGKRENGDVFSFDISDRAMGPHGIVAGTSGYGKSEILTTLILSVAVNYHPAEVNFILIDFKGDGLGGGLMSLPHIAGKISNINDISVIERNLRSLRAENKRRQIMFANAKEKLKTDVDNIHKYQELWREGALSEPMPYLLIVVDEFAEMKQQFPEKMDDIIQVARIGRSLGVYLTLATQQPGGIVSGQVAANTRFRISMKTASAADSKEILGKPDAESITAKGRAIIKVGSDEIYEQIQSFYSKAPYDPSSGGVAVPETVSVVDLTGRRMSVKSFGQPAKKSSLSEGRAIADYIDGLAKNMRIPAVRPVWTDPLPQRVKLMPLISGQTAFNESRGVWARRNDKFSVPIGILDNPDTQTQYPLVLELDGHHVLYGMPQTGKTTFLQTVVLSTAFMYTPGQLRFVMFDFGNYGLNVLGQLPHSFAVTNGSDLDTVKKAEAYLLTEIEARKKKFAKVGANSITTYSALSGDELPVFMVVIDNLQAANNIYPNFMDSLLIVARDGGGLGVYIVMTSGSLGGFMFKLESYIKYTFALQLVNKSDFRQLVGGDGKQEPSHFPGRGLAKGALEFQVALYADSDDEIVRIKTLRDLCQKMVGTWTGSVDKLIRQIPSNVSVSSLTATEDAAQIGIDCESGNAVSFNFSDMHGCVISGVDKSGKSNLLACIVRGFSGNSNVGVYIYEKGETVRSACRNAKSTNDGFEFGKFINEIADEFDNRSESGVTSPQIIICIDDFAAFFDEVGDNEGEILNRIVLYGKECGIYTYIAENPKKYNTLVHILSSCLANGNGVAIGDRLKTHNVLHGLHQSDDIAFGDYEAAVIHEGAVQTVKLAKI